MLNRYYINLAYCMDPEALMIGEGRSSDVSPQSHALAFCMHATAINRLFDKTTCYEFLVRMAYILRDRDIVDSYLKSPIGDEVLFHITAFSRKYTIYLEDLAFHLGLEICDSLDDIACDRTEWMEKSGTYWRNACLAAILGRAPMLENLPIMKGKHIVAPKRFKMDDKEYVYIADLFAREVLKSIGEEPFEDLDVRVLERQTYLKEYREELATRPLKQFNYAKIPLETKKKLFTHICGPVLKYHDDFEEVVNDADSTFAHLVYLAWIFAHGHARIYMIEELGTGRKARCADVDPRLTEFDYEWYEGLNELEIGVNIFDTFRWYDLQKVAYLLKEDKLQDDE